VKTAIIASLAMMVPLWGFNDRHLAGDFKMVWMNGCE
jgi:hypothetical protein